MAAFELSGSHAWLDARSRPSRVLVLGMTSTLLLGCGARTDLTEGGDAVPLDAHEPRSTYEFDAPRRVPRAPEAEVPVLEPTRPSPPERPSRPRPVTLPEPAPEPEAPPVEPPAAVAVQETPEDEQVPEECQLAPVDPVLPEESFEILGDLVEEDYLPEAAERWNWTGDSDGEPHWPYPSRAVWPAQVELPTSSDEDVELVAIGGSSAENLYVVGSRDDTPLLLHLRDGEWLDESALVLAALPDASELNSVVVVAPDQVWVSAPEGLLRSDGNGWATLEVSKALLPLGAAWFDADGFGVVAGGSVATTTSAGSEWSLETRGLGFVAPGMAYSRSFVRVAGHEGVVSAVGAYGHLLTRSGDGWSAATVFGSDVAFTDAGQFVATRRPSAGLLFRQSPETWQIYPVAFDTGYDGSIARVWASPEGDVFAGGSIYAVLHRFADGTLELLPSEVNELRDFYANSSRLFALEETTLWEYDLGDVTSSGVTRAAIVDEALFDIAPDPETSWGQRAASNFEPLICVDAELFEPGAPVWQGELPPKPPEDRYGSCSFEAERSFSETAFSFEAPVEGTYRIVLSEPEASEDDERRLELALRNGCEGWLIWGGGRGGASDAVDIGLEAGQLLLIEVYATDALDEPVPFELSIY